MRLGVRGVCAAAVFTLLASGFPATAGAVGSCFDPNAPTTVEQRRLDDDVAGEILRRSGFDRIAEEFQQELCGIDDHDDAKRFVRSEGKRLWETTVARAQGRLPAMGDLPADDDRPLYWARLHMTRSLARWQPGFELGPAERAELVASFERGSRGQSSVKAPAGVKRVLVSGFDPFQLDTDIRRSNPSGAVALALDGTVLDTPSGPARVETVMFPVLWEPFERGVVERTFLPHVRPGPEQVDLFATVSQGRPERFDIERWNGRWHEGTDNNREVRGSVITVPPELPTLDPPPEFVPTTQPYAEIVAADTGRFPVFDNTEVTEIPRGETEPVIRPDGPTPGSQARAGGGGSYLSNEVAYRTTLLRDAVGAEIPGGHVHTPILEFGPGNTTEITDPVFEANRRDINAQFRTILTVAVGAGAAGDPFQQSVTPRSGPLPPPSM
ncbi:pyroglutamyl peptidase [Saccharopolyspora sp. CA-218241]|uniref:pyroglutamyl peptidase n=1 Tax=Saccharopolyspora sp. CA-218241 TaxID=3240027 RepID=UPI003D964345